MNRYKETVTVDQVENIILEIENQKFICNWKDRRDELKEVALLDFLPTINPTISADLLILDHWIEYFEKCKPAVAFIVQKINDHKIKLWKEDVTIPKLQQVDLDKSINKPLSEVSA